LVDIGFHDALTSILQNQRSLELRWFFVYFHSVQFKRLKRTPVILVLLVLALVGGLRLLNPDFFDRLERMTYDLRVRTAHQFSTPAATNLAFISIEESSIAAVKNSEQLGFHYGLYWPRQVYGRLVEELSAQGAKAVAFDILFDSLRHDHPAVIMADGRLLESDEFFAQQMRLASNVLIAVTPEIAPPKLFTTNALDHGDISAGKDSDGILRRAQAFCIVRHWHPLIENAAFKNGLRLDALVVEKSKVVLPLTNGETLEIALDKNGEMDVKSSKTPAPQPAKARPFTDECVWHMGIVLAAQELKLDLAHAEIDLPHGKITLHGAGGIRRVIPVDAGGSFYIDWRLTQDDVQLTRAPIEKLLFQEKLRLLGATNGLSSEFKGKLIVVGSAAQGNDLTDRGATPLENDTLLVSKHWNVASSVITGRFIQRTALPAELALIIFLGLLTAFLTWQLRAFTASATTLLLICSYIGVVFFVFVEFRFWLPVIFPVIGAILCEHVSLVTYRVVFEEREQRRVKSVFSKIVAPSVVNELLKAEKLSLGGARCEVSVFFADVRGFTTLTDQVQEEVAEYVRHSELDAAAAEKCFDESARETLETVNLYLAAVADSVKKHNGTLDKYIGDCVMAFWNAPAPDASHALNCVRAAIDAQRAIYELNQKRLAQNTAREIENRARASAGLPPRPMLVALQLGTGINTGLVTVGLMGSDAHIYNYTVFGREVNLASRLEGVSGSGRIIISDTTYNHLLRLDPQLVSTCAELFPVTVKGIRNAVRIYEVPWQSKE
jgi:class 3 adenylate cyclase/CHASE2 domain-containing sensor protein